MIIRDLHGLVGTITGVVLITVAALPLAALAVWVLVRRRSTTGPRARAWKTSLADIGIVYGTLPWVWMIMLPGGRAGDVPGRVSLVPLRDLVSMSTTQVIGNLLVFAALGFFARCASGRWRRYRGSCCSGRSAPPWSRPRNTSCDWTGCPRWTTSCSTPRAPV